MSDPSSNQVTIHHPKLVSNWSIETIDNLFSSRIEKPDFDNKVDEIIYILEHENDPKFVSLDDLAKNAAIDIAREIDIEIMNAITKATGK